jgi:hypothetical protein
LLSAGEEFPLDFKLPLSDLYAPLLLSVQDGDEIFDFDAPNLVLFCLPLPFEGATSDETTATEDDGCPGGTCNGPW